MTVEDTGDAYEDGHAGVVNVDATVVGPPPLEHTVTLAPEAGHERTLNEEKVQLLPPLHASVAAAMDHDTTRLVEALLSGRIETGDAGSVGATATLTAYMCVHICNN